MEGMKTEKFFHMVGGEGPLSYASNSSLQGKVFEMGRVVVEEAIARICASLTPECLVVADLGCSSSANMLRGLSTVVHVAGDRGYRPAEIQYYINDLPGNDFNTVFKLLNESTNDVAEAGRRRSIPNPCYVMGVPGSFYKRLFPASSVHFFHSTCCISWLSQVPPGVYNENNIYITEICPPCVYASYLKQFQEDLTNFLRCRSKEIISGGEMMLSFAGRMNKFPIGEYSDILKLLANALHSMSIEGIIDENALKAFNVPYYSPSLDEVQNIVDEEGSFMVDDIKMSELNWDPYDDDTSDDTVRNSVVSGENVANCIRAVYQPLLAPRFGEEIMDEVFARYAVNVGRHLLKEKTKHAMFVISLKVNKKT